MQQRGQGGAEGLTRAEIGQALSVPHGTVDRAVIALLERGAAHKANDGLPGRCPARVIARELGNLPDSTPQSGRLLVLEPLDDDHPSLALVLLVMRDRHDPEPVQAEQQRRSVSHARGSQCG